MLLNVARNLLLFDSQTNLEYIGEDAFRFCVSLISIFIPTSCQEIDDFAFDCCYKLILLCVPQHTELGYKVIDHTTLAKVNTRFNNGVKDDEWIKDIKQAEEFALHQASSFNPMEEILFPQSYTNPATRAQNIVTNVYRHAHQALFSYPGSVYLTYTRPTFPFIDGIRAPDFGHYPEAHFDRNLPNLDRSLPHVDIVPVDIHQYHPMSEYISTITGRLTITWSFKSHDYRDNNQLLGKTPETFILTFYPPLPMNPPFQI